MNRIKKIFAVLLLCVFLLSASNVVVYALSSSDISTTSPAYGYYFPSESLSYSVTVSGASNNPATVKVLYPYYTYNSQARSTLKTLSRNGSSYTYTGSSTPSTSVWVPGRKPGSHSTWQTRSFYIEVSKDGTTVVDRVSGYITLLPRSYYSSIDSTFWYINRTSNPFYGVGTPDPSENSLTYNCLSYVVAINTSWQWPWGVNPTQAELDAYMMKSGDYSSRAGNSFVPTTRNGCDVIYYSDSSWGSGTDGHFAKVIAWDALGNPTMISSKWGKGEIIESSSYDPFTGYVYGSPKRYYKYG